MIYQQWNENPQSCKPIHILHIKSSNSVLPKVNDYIPAFCQSWDYYSILTEQNNSSVLILLVRELFRSNIFIKYTWEKTELNLWKIILELINNFQALLLNI